MTKIVYITSSLINVGGKERILTDKMNYLAEHSNYEVHVITWEQNGLPPVFNLSPLVKHHDMNVLMYKMYKHIFFTRLFIALLYKKRLYNNIQKKIDKISPNIIIGVAFEASDVFCRLKTNAIKVIESHCAKRRAIDREVLHLSILSEMKKCINYVFISKEIERNANHIVTLTNGDAMEWKHPKITVIPNMLRKHSYKVEDYSVKRVITVGRQVYQKGYDILITLWKSIYLQYPDWELSIYGDGIAKDTLQKQIETLKLEDSITLHDSVNNAFAEYAKSSIFVLPSRYEGFGLALGEAMSCGLPVVAFDCPYGPSDIIRNEEDGFLIRPYNTMDFESKLQFLMEHEEERIRMGNNARRNITRFDEDKIMPQWINLFDRLTHK